MIRVFFLKSMHLLFSVFSRRYVYTQKINTSVSSCLCEILEFI